jgi:hypothetical protein
MSAPDNICRPLCAGNRILQSQFLPHAESLRQDRQAPIRADIYRVPFDRVLLPFFRPFHLNLHTGVQSQARPHVFGPRRLIRFLQHTHRCLLRFPCREALSFDPPRLNCRATVHGFLRITPPYGLHPPRSMGLPLPHPRPVTLPFSVFSPPMICHPTVVRLASFPLYFPPLRSPCPLW